MHSALCRSGGLLKNLIDNLDGRNGTEWETILQRVLRRENPFVYAVPQKWEPCFSVIIDNKDDDKMLDILQEHYGLSDSDRKHYKSIGKSIFWSMDPWREGIAVIALCDLGFDVNERITFADLWVKAKQSGLRPCMGSTAARTLLHQFAPSNLPYGLIHFVSIPEKERISCIRIEGDDYQLFTEEMRLVTECSTTDLWAFQASTGR